MARTRPVGTGIPRLLIRPGRTTRARVVGVLLLAFSLRALIPLGFMPAADGTLSLMICPAGFPAWLLHGPGMDPGKAMPGGMTMPQPPPHPGQQHGQGLTDEGYCAFTTGFCSAPPPPLLVGLSLVLACVAVIAVTMVALAGIRLVHLPQARAPPAPR